MKIFNTLPLRFLSYYCGKIANLRIPVIKNFLIKCFISFYRINLNECKYKNLDHYQNFNDFFTRELAPGKRFELFDENFIVSPAEGFISEIGKISTGKLLQAKNHQYDLRSLLGNREDYSKLFEEGNFVTIYLAPQNYHRVHMPTNACLKQMIYIPGQLFSVNPWSLNHISELFCHNERVVCIFNTIIGPMAMILVGAFLVGSITTSWHGEVNAEHSLKMNSWDYEDKKVCLNQHEEMGKFQYGSTVILLFPNNLVEWNTDLATNKPIQVGEVIACIKNKNSTCT